MRPSKTPSQCSHTHQCPHIPKAAAPHDVDQDAHTKMPMSWNKAARVHLVVVVALTIVHCAGGTGHTKEARAETPPAKAGATAPAIAARQDTTLPTHVIEMRDLILAAVRSGRIEDLQTAIDQNELPPEVGAPQGVAPVDHLRKVSADGEGRELLAVLANLLQSDPILMPIGRDVENNRVYVWPSVSEANFEKLTPAQEVALYRLMPVASAKAMIATKKWTWWRLAIGADGTWLTFIKRD